VLRQPHIRKQSVIPAGFPPRRIVYKKMVAPDGFEPPTQGFSVPRSTS
jgi:hypothetical protein